MPQPLKQRLCLHCDSVFTRNKAQRPANRTRRAYCDACVASRVYVKPRIRLRTCAYCADQFAPGKSRRKYCDACALAQVWQLKAPKSENRNRKVCSGGCGVERITSRASLPQGEYMCQRCRGTNAAHRAKLRAKRNAQRNARSGDFRRRARYFGVEYEPVDKRKVFTRDNWRCGIPDCGKKVDKRLKYPHPMSASLDHVIPMSSGGGHLYANVQCSHLKCNVQKGARGGGEQLAIEVAC